MTRSGVHHLKSMAKKRQKLDPSISSFYLADLQLLKHLKLRLRVILNLISKMMTVSLNQSMSLRLALLVLQSHVILFAVRVLQCINQKTFYKKLNVFMV